MRPIGAGCASATTARGIRPCGSSASAAPAIGMRCWSVWRWCLRVGCVPGSESLTTDLQSAIAAHKAGQLTQAERLYRQHLAAEPQAALALSNLGQILLARGEAEAAL